MRRSSSDLALAAVFREGETLSIRSWPADPRMSIFAHELFAHILSLSLVPLEIRTVGVAIDNLNALSSITKGHSSSSEVNTLLRHYFRLRQLRVLNVSATYVPSRRMLADFPSRQAPLPHDAMSYFASAPVPSPLPFFRAPAR